MKKLLLILATALAVTSCSEDDFGTGGNGLQAVSHQVTLKYADDNLSGVLVDGGLVKLTNTNTGDIIEGTTNANGIVNFNQLLPGTYNITASKNLSASVFAELFGYSAPSSEVVFNGVADNVVVNINLNATVIELKAARLGDLVIKQIYYAGSHTTQGASFRDQFIEIYNNSNETIYADGLYIALLQTKNNTTVTSFSLANGQYDWSKSIGLQGMGNAANTNYVYADYVVQIPGGGRQYPILPGASIVVASSALNHKSPLVDLTGNPININNPDLTVDLSGADFEAYLGDFRISIGEEPYKYDIENPAVPNLNIAYWGRPGYYGGNKDLLMDALGRDSYIIFRASDFALYQNYSQPDVTEIVSATKFCVQIPVSVIIDGVDTQNFNQASPRPKCLPSEIDASYTATDASYNSQSVIRKTKEIASDGRIILLDSNNSATDFVKLNRANPRGFAN